MNYQSKHVQSVEIVEERRQKIEALIRDTNMTNADIVRELGVHRDLVAKLRIAVMAGDTTHDKRVVTVPEGKVLSELCIKGIEMEEEGFTQKEIVTELGLSDLAYRQARDIVQLSRNRRLSRDEQASIQAAVHEMDETRRVSAIHAQWIPFFERMWGKESGAHNGRREEKVVQDYMHAISVFAETAISIRELAVPFLDQEEHRLMRHNMERGISAAREAVKRLKGDIK